MARSKAFDDAGNPTTFPRSPTPVKRLGYVPCSICGARFTEMGDHLITRMIAAGWTVSAMPPHNLCPSCQLEVPRGKK